MTISYSAATFGDSIGSRTTVLGDYWSSIDSTEPAGRLGMVLNADPYAGYQRLDMPLYQKTISGTVQESGSPCARRVRCYDRESGRLLGDTMSNATTGAFSFGNLDDDRQYFVVAFDADGDPDFNALIFDKIIPG